MDQTWAHILGTQTFWTLSSGLGSWVHTSVTLKASLENPSAALCPLPSTSFQFPSRPYIHWPICSAQNARTFYLHTYVMANGQVRQATWKVKLRYYLRRLLVSSPLPRRSNYCRFDTLSPLKWSVLVAIIVTLSTRSNTQVLMLSLIFSWVFVCLRIHSDI